MFYISKLFLVLQAWESSVWMNSSEMGLIEDTDHSEDIFTSIIYVHNAAARDVGRYRYEQCSTSYEFLDFIFQLCWCQWRCCWYWQSSRDVSVCVCEFWKLFDQHWCWHDVDGDHDQWLRDTHPLHTHHASHHCSSSGWWSRHQSQLHVWSKTRFHASGIVWSIKMQKKFFLENHKIWKLWYF